MTTKAFTLKEAGRKLCPLQGGKSCMGDKCMMWRWATYPQYAAKMEAAAHAVKFPLYEEDKRGFCGMAGPLK